MIKFQFQYNSIKICLWKRSIFGYTLSTWSDKQTNFLQNIPYTPTRKWKPIFLLVLVLSIICKRPAQYTPNKIQIQLKRFPKSWINLGCTNSLVHKFSPIYVEAYLWFFPALLLFHLPSQYFHANLTISRIFLLYCHHCWIRYSFVQINLLRKDKLSIFTQYIIQLF